MSLSEPIRYDGRITVGPRLISDNLSYSTCIAITMHKSVFCMWPTSKHDPCYLVFRTQNTIVTASSLANPDHRTLANDLTRDKYGFVY